MSGDGGVKALLTKQFARAVFGVNLVLPAPPAVEVAWREGLYPFRPPFVYDSGANHVVAFPFAFEALCAPAYRLLGFRGFYVVPLLSLWATWLVFSKTLARLEVPPWARTIAVAGLAFASHLTLYAAMFWEHTLGVLLAYVGIHFALTRRLVPWRTTSAFLVGLAFGASFFIRAEALLFVLCLCGFLAATTLPRPDRSVVAFLAGSACAIVAVGAVNAAVYGRVLGAHGRQIVEQSTLAHQLSAAVGIALRLWANLAIYSPLAVFVVAWAVTRRPSLQRTRLEGPFGLLIPCAAFLLLLPAIVPNSGGYQIGPRYELLVVPVFAVLTAVALPRVRTAGASERWLLALCGAALAVGFALDTVRGGWRVTHDYLEKMEAIEAVRSRPDRVLCTTDSFVAQELEAVIPDKLPLLVNGRADELQAVQVARSLGPPGALFAAFVYEGSPNSRPETDATLLGTFGELALYEIGAGLPVGSL